MEKSFSLAGIVATKNTISGPECSDLRSCAFLEFRFDLFDLPDDCENFFMLLRRRFPRHDLLGTIRLKKDGGNWPDEYSDRRANLFLQMIHAGFDWVDLELDDTTVFSDLADNMGKTKLLLSSHDFHSAPTSITYLNAKRRAQETGARALKFAVSCQTNCDEDTLYDFIEKNQEGNILPVAFSIGENFRRTRLVSLLLGAGWTYGSLDGKVSAPGLMPVEQIARFLKNSWNSKRLSRKEAVECADIFLSAEENRK